MNDIQIVNNTQSEMIEQLMAENTMLKNENRRLKRNSSDLVKILAIAIGRRTICIRPEVMEAQEPSFILDENLSGDMLIKIKENYYV